jgi:nicotinic acid mononucleotide adenylyltransferase
MKKSTRACYPGTFNPPTIAHLAVANAALVQLDIDEVVFVLTERTLGKDDAQLPSARHRASELRSLSNKRFDAVVTDQSLLAEIAQGYDWLIMGADKWEQINEVRWYGDSAERRDAAIQALPSVAVVPRPPFGVPNHLVRLEIAEHFAEVSSTAVRSGRQDWHANPARCGN